MKDPLKAAPCLVEHTLGKLLWPGLLIRTWLCGTSRLQQIPPHPISVTMGVFSHQSVISGILIEQSGNKCWWWEQPKGPVVEEPHGREEREHCSSGELTEVSGYKALCVE